MSDEIEKKELTILHKTICKDLTDEEFQLFLLFCKHSNLDPFKLHLHPVKYGNRLTIITGIDDFRIIAERSGKYRGQTTPEFCGEDGVWTELWKSKEHPFAAKVGVYREDFDKPVYAVALWSEYYPGGGAKFQTVKLAKCAEALALRKTFPNELGSIYAEEEMLWVDANEQEHLREQHLTAAREKKALDNAKAKAQAVQPPKSQSPQVTKDNGIERDNEVWKIIHALGWESGQKDNAEVMLIAGTTLGLLPDKVNFARLAKERCQQAVDALYAESQRRKVEKKQLPPVTVPSEITTEFAVKYIRDHILPIIPEHAQYADEKSGRPLHVRTDIVLHVIPNLAISPCEKLQKVRDWFRLLQIPVPPELAEMTKEK